MNQILQELLRIAPPPTVPAPALCSWEEAASVFGITFPDDFKEVAEQYGEGRFTPNGIELISPIHNPDRARAERTILSNHDSLTHLNYKIKSPLVYPFLKAGSETYFFWLCSDSSNVYCSQYFGSALEPIKGELRSVIGLILRLTQCDNELEIDSSLECIHGSSRPHKRQQFVTSMEMAGRELVWGLKMSDANVVSASLRRGADPNVGDEHGLCALDIALRSKSPSELVRILLKHGADPSIASDANLLAKILSE